MIDPSTVALFIPPGLKKFKLDLFERIGQKIGRTVRHEFHQLTLLPWEVRPIVGCTPELRPIIDDWLRKRRPFIYWDRGYARRVFATWLPRGDGGGYYRWHLNSYQMQWIMDVPADRWDALHTPVTPWRKEGKHIVVARPSDTYARFHKLDGWLDKTVYQLSLVTQRQIVVRDKESKRPLSHDLAGAHALVTHGSNAAVEAVIMGCPVFVDRTSAAALVGKTDLAEIEAPAYPDRTQWLHSLAYCQFNETELVDGTLWRLIK